MAMQVIVEFGEVINADPVSTSKRWFIYYLEIQDT